MLIAWRGSPPPADIILVTHEHFDHLSKDDIAKLSTPGTAVVGPAEVTGQLTGETHPVTPGDTITVQGVVVTAVPAYNTSKFRSPGVLFHPPADGKVGYVVEMDGRRIYHAGDTDAIPEMAQIDVDVALIPVSGTYVMTAEEAVEALKNLASLASDLDGMIRQFRLEGDRQAGGKFTGGSQLVGHSEFRPAHS